MEESAILLWNTLAALATSMISAILGMGGGITLISVMVLLLPVKAVVPLHGCIQLLSNSTRLFLFRRSIHWKFAGRFAAAAIPCSLAGIYLVDVLDDSTMRLLFGIFILFSLYVPIKKLPALSRFTRSFYLAGALAGSISLIVGATGPIIAPFFLHKDLRKDQIIATKAVCQALVHVLKIPLFGVVLSFSFQDYSLLLLSMGIAVILGTWLGKQVLSRYVSERVFLLLYQLLLTIIGCRLVFMEAVKLF